jgi:hypothetical protein
MDDPSGLSGCQAKVNSQGQDFERNSEQKERFQMKDRFA